MARYLGQAELWWVLCDYNAIFFPLELNVGAFHWWSTRVCVLSGETTRHSSMMVKGIGGYLVDTCGMPVRTGLPTRVPRLADQ